MFFTETNPNLIFDGIFTKMNYCDEFFTMYGIYINVPCVFVPYAKSKIDISTLNALIKIEYDILNLYAKNKKTNLKILFSTFIFGYCSLIYCIRKVYAKKCINF